MDMSAQSEQVELQVSAARLARSNAQRMRMLAAERAEKLERQLQAAAVAGLKAEISRGIVARNGLRAVADLRVSRQADPLASPPAHRTRAAGYAAAAFGLFLGAAALGMGWVPSQNAAVPVLAGVPGEPLRLALTYTVSAPTGR